MKTKIEEVLIVAGGVTIGLILAHLIAKWTGLGSASTSVTG